MTTDLYKVPDAVPPIHAELYHMATDKGPSIDGGKFRSIFSDNLQPIATRGKKARGTLLVDKHCHKGCSIKRAPLSVSYYNEISGGHIWRGLVRRSGSAGPVLHLWSWLCICGQGTAEKLVQHLILHNSAADPTYVDDFLLTYRTFLKSAAEITSQLLSWFDDPTHADKVRHNGLFLVITRVYANCIIWTWMFLGG